jgi:dihydroorotate dehydrogenase (NAD+) catalytic subunit
MADLTTELAGLKLKNPVLTASGTYAAGKEYGRLIDLSLLGALCVKTVTLKPIAGNKPPRLWETPSGMLNSIGLQNAGIDAFVAEELPFLAEQDVPVILSIAGTSIDDYIRLAKMVAGLDGVDAVELNVSCPNLKAGGTIFGSDIKLAAELTAKAKLACSKPLIVKLTPNVADISAVARACERAGADGLSLINTIKGMAVDVETMRPGLGNVIGGLSGPAIKPIAVRMVWETSRAVGIPIIGMGGIMTADDALEFILAGANAVAVGTANFVDPQVPLKVIEGINDYLDRHGVDRLSDLVGALRVES